MTKVTAFLADAIIAAGDPADVTRAIEHCRASDRGRIRVFDDESGRVVDLDHGGEPKAGRGRPKLGVLAREVTLLPKHWDWLSRQRGGASATLRRLVDEASRGSERDDRARRDAVYRFLQETSGDRPGYEEALRALYRGDDEGFWQRLTDWPQDVRRYAEGLLA